jgi:hypothetical protein
MATSAGLPYENLDPLALSAHLDEERRERQPKRRRGQRDYVQVRLTDPLVHAVQPPAREEWICDGGIPYLALRIQPGGSKSWYYLYSDRDEQHSERVHLGSASDYSVEEARRKAEWRHAGHYGIARRTPRLRRDMPMREVVTLYFFERSPTDSDWFRVMERLFVRYLTPRFGSQPLSALDRDRWLLLAEKVAADRPTRGVNFLKGAKAFLSWAVERGLLQANPLAKAKLDLPAVRQTTFLSVDEIRAIFEAAARLGHPWAAMVGLVILTGEHIEDVREIRGEAIFWNESAWAVEYDRCRGPQMDTSRRIDLAPEAMALLASYRDKRGYLFASPRVLLTPKPINFYAEINERLRQESGVLKLWTARDLWLSVQREAERLKKGTGTWTAWAAWIASGRHPNAEDFEVEL